MIEDIVCLGRIAEKWSATYILDGLLVAQALAPLELRTGSEFTLFSCFIFSFAYSISVSALYFVFFRERGSCFFLIRNHRKWVFAKLKEIQVA